MRTIKKFVKVEIVSNDQKPCLPEVGQFWKYLNTDPSNTIYLRIQPITFHGIPCQSNLVFNIDMDNGELYTVPMESVLKDKIVRYKQIEPIKIVAL